MARGRRGGFVSVIGHVVADQLRALHAAFEAGDVARAREINTALLPVSRAMDRVGGVVFAKAALRLVGLDVGEPRLPLPRPTTPRCARSPPIWPPQASLSPSRAEGSHPTCLVPNVPTVVSAVASSRVPALHRRRR